MVLTKKYRFSCVKPMFFDTAKPQIPKFLFRGSSLNLPRWHTRLSLPGQTWTAEDFLKEQTYDIRFKISPAEKVMRTGVTDSNLETSEATSSVQSLSNEAPISFFEG